MVAADTSLIPKDAKAPATSVEPRQGWRFVLSAYASAAIIRWGKAYVAEFGTRSKTDDQAAQLFLAFTKTKAIVYIWDTSAPQGLMESTSPVPFMTVKVVVVRSGPVETGKWITETLNVYEDYKTLYGAEPPLVTGAPLQLYSQHTGTSAESYFADVFFKKQ